MIKFCHYKISKIFNFICLQNVNFRFCNVHKNPQDVDVVFIRHAQSKINYSTKTFSQKYKIPGNYENLKKYPEWVHGVRFSVDYVDSPITDQGKQQCLRARKITDKLKPDVILVSPLQRTLQTCDLMFGDRDTPIFVQPVLIQSLRSAGDICGQIQPKVKRFPKFNFESALKLGQMWNIQYDQQHSENYRKTIAETGSKTLVQKNKAILDYMAKNVSFQSGKNIRQRIKKVKQLLKNYRDRYNYLVVVTHSNIINYTLAKQFNDISEPKKLIHIQNCQIHFDKVSQILKYQ